MISIAVSVIFIAALVLAIWCYCKSRNQEETDDDVNPTYGDYEVPDPVVEVEDSNDYYSEVYVEGTSRVRDNNSMYTA